MPVSSDLVRISIAPEATYGLPSTTAGDWDVFPIVNETLGANAETSLSNLLDDSRQVKDSSLVNITAQGDLASELVICGAFDTLLESAMSAAPTNGTRTPDEDPANAMMLKVGQTIKSFTIEKRFPDPEGTPGTDFLYQVVTGAVVNVLSVRSSPNEPITYSVSIIGKEYIEGVTGESASGTDITGTPWSIALPLASAPNPVTDPVVLRAPETVNLEFGGGTFAGETITSRCFGAFSFNVNNNYRGIPCIGTLGNKHVALGRCEVDLGATIHLKDNLLLEALLAQTEHTVTFRVQAADDPITTFDGMFSSVFPRAKFATNQVVAGGTGTDVVNEMTMNALYDDTAATTLTLEWGDGAVAV